MSLRSNPAVNIFRLIVVVIGFAALILRSIPLASIEGRLGVALVIGLFSALLTFFPINLFARDYSLVFILALGSALAFPVSLVGWSLALGLVAGWLARGSGWGRRFSFSGSGGWLKLFSEIAQIYLSLILALSLSGISSKGVQTLADVDVAPHLYFYPILWFALFHSTLVVLDAYYDRANHLPNFRRDIAWFSAIELLGLTFVLLTVLAFRSFIPGGLALLGWTLLVVAVLLNNLWRLWQDRQRFMGDLSTLHQVSDMLQSTLEMDQLLPALQERVSKYLGVDNFYIAIYNPQEGKISYPLAVKHGSRQSWASRPIADRLTDRVILERKPILISSHARQEIARIGLPVGEDTPNAWMGVPLLSSDQAIGCLAVFTYSPNVEFSQEDLELFVTLSGQVSVAVANALLYEQVQRRATQLETINRFTASITQSLVIEDVYSQVCLSASRLSGSCASAIFVLDLERGIVTLAHSLNLADALVREYRSFSFTSDERAHCLHTGQPELVSDASELEPHVLGDLFQREGIAALANFPMISADGPVGYVSLYFDARHEFNPEEVELLQSLAAQSAMAISNARLHQRTDMALSRRVHQLSILQNINRELSRAVYSQELFDLILNYAMEFSSSNWGMIGMLDPADGSLIVRAYRGYPQSIRTLPVEQGPVAQAIRQLKPMNIPDLAGIQDHLDFTQGLAKSHLSIPLIYQAQPLGVITLESSLPSAFTGADEAFVSQMANQAAIALQNARLYSEIAQVRDRLAAVLDSVAEGILLVQPDGVVVLANKSAEMLLERSIGEILGKRLDHLPPAMLACLGYSSEEAESLVRQFGEARLRDDQKAVTTIRSARGSAVFERTISAVIGEAGREVGWMLILRDVSEEHRIAEARELITETLIHDLRSPVSAILGALEVIETALPDASGGENDVTVQALQVARRGAQRVLSLIETLMDISRMQSGKMEITRALVDLQSLVKGVVNEFLPQSNEYGLILRNDLPPGLPYLYVDPAKITRVIANLIDNALKFAPSGSQIVISGMVDEKNCLVISISDQGPGIPAEYRQKVFERFSQVPGVRGRRRGTGLGLTFCKLAVEAHGGSIWVEPNTPQGSRFTFALPLPGAGDLFFDTPARVS